MALTVQYCIACNTFSLTNELITTLIAIVHFVQIYPAKSYKKDEKYAESKQVLPDNGKHNVHIDALLHWKISSNVEVDENVDKL